MQQSEIVLRKEHALCRSNSQFTAFKLGVVWPLRIDEGFSYWINLTFSNNSGNVPSNHVLEVFIIAPLSFVTEIWRQRTELLSQFFILYSFLFDVHLVAVETICSDLCSRSSYNCFTLHVMTMNECCPTWLSFGLLYRYICDLPYFCYETKWNVASRFPCFQIKVFSQVW